VGSLVGKNILHKQQVQRSRGRKDDLLKELREVSSDGAWSKAEKVVI